MVYAFDVLFQLVQATIVVEDMVKTEYLKKRMVVLVFSFSGC